MEIRHLGTAAAERVPGLFCVCKICDNARKTGGKEIRTQSQALIDKTILIDFPGDTYLHCLNYGLDLPTIEHLLITHWHSDHLYAEDLAYRMSGYANCLNNTLTVYGNDTTFQFYERAFFLEQRHDFDQIRFQLVRPGDTIDIDDRYRVWAYQATHGHQFGDAQFYAVSDHKRTLLYAHDTGVFLDEVWEQMVSQKQRFDYVSLDCTEQTSQTKTVHMTFKENVEIKERMLDLNLAHANTVFVSNHFSHNGGETYESMTALAKTEDFKVSYDNMVVNF
ncbi:MAG: MBL fold metallo-hydrolase [Actinomycetaceae bacterium]|nr:MBL fold metallo-hydrolase [Actinomycetaceae bacterium]